MIRTIYAAWAKITCLIVGFTIVIPILRAGDRVLLRGFDRRWLSPPSHDNTLCHRRDDLPIPYI